MSIRVGKQEELGGIKYLGPRKSDSEDINAVFIGERMIWPSVSKYLFHVSEGSFYDPNSYSIVINCNPAKQDKTIYVRSCTRYFTRKYGCYVMCPSTWLKVNDQELGIENEVDIAMSREECAKDRPDTTFTISVEANPTNISRTAVLTIYQTDDTQSNAPTGKTMRIYVIQEADYPDNSSISYDNMAITWYSDGEYMKTTDSYGTKANPVVSASGGKVQVYFSLYLNVRMMSGYYSRSYYGNSSGQDVKNVRVRVGNQEWSVVSVGGGMFMGEIEITSQISSDSTVIPEISNLIVSNNGDVTYDGGYLSVSWQTFATVTSPSASNSISVTVPERNGIPVGSIPCWQGGGTYYKKVTNLDTGVSIPSEYSSFIHKYKDLSISSDGTYSQMIKVDSAPEVSSWVIENVTCYQMHEDPSTGYIEDFDGDGLSANYSDDVKFEFDIIEKNGSRIERSGNVVVYANATKSVTRQATITQVGKVGSGTQKVSWMDPADAEKNFVTSEMPTIDGNNIFKSFTLPSYKNYKWNIIGHPNTNDPIKSDYEIEVWQFDELLSSDTGVNTIAWTVKSGTTNSMKRTSTLKFFYPTKNMSSLTSVTQNGSNVEEGYQYHKDLCKNLGGGRTTVQNLTDGQTISSDDVDIQGTMYYASVPYLKNMSKDDTSVAYVKPTEIKTWSVGDVDNLCNSAFYVSIYGKNVYKGKERKVTFRITLSDLRDSTTDKNVAKTLMSTQKGSTTVIDDDSSAPCVGIDEDSFSVADGSEGKISEGFSLISESAGIYKIPVHVNDNTAPTSRTFTVNYNYQEYHNPLNLMVPNFYSTLSVPMSASWSQLGKPVDRSITLKIDMMDGDVASLSGTWKNILYTGDMSNHTIYGTDYKVVLPSGCSWISPSSTVVTFSPNDTQASRSATVSVNYYNDGQQIGSIPVTFNQEVTSREVSFTFTTSIDENGWYEIDSDGLEFYLQSFDNYDSKEVYVEDVYDKTKIKITKKTEDNSTRYVVTPVDPSRSTTPVKHTLTLNQYDRTAQKKVASKTISMYEAGYEFSVAASNTLIDPSNPTCTLNVNSVKKTIDNNGLATSVALPYFFSQSDYNIGMMSDNYFICTSINRSGAIKSTNITCTQSVTGKRETVQVREKWWSENDLDTSDADLLTLSDSVTREFSSSTSDGLLLPKIEYYTGTMKSIDGTIPVKTSIVANGAGKYRMTLSLTKENNGDMQDYGLFRVCNDKWEIGRFYVKRHAWWFDATTEDKSKGYVWYVSSHAGILWSLYYINSRYDGNFTDYDVTITSGNYYLYKDENTVTLRPNDDNNSSSRVIGQLDVVQKTSGKKLTIRIEQLTKSEDYDISI